MPCIVCFFKMHQINLGYSYSWNVAKEGDSERTARRAASVPSSSPPISQLFPMFRLLSLLCDRVANELKASKECECCFNIVQIDSPPFG